MMISSLAKYVFMGEIITQTGKKYFLLSLGQIYLYGKGANNMNIYIRLVSTLRKKFKSHIIQLKGIYWKDCKVYQKH